MIVFHHNDSDGYGAAWAVWNKYPLAKYIEINFDNQEEKITNEVENQDVIFVDFKPNEHILNKLRNIVKSLLVIDHHNTSLPHKNEGDFIVDMNHAGCILAWQYFNPTSQVPTVLKYIEDFDIWKFELPKSEEISEYIHSYKLSIPVIDKLANDLDTNFYDAYLQGAALLRNRNSKVEKIAKNAIETVFHGHKALIVNSSIYQSHIGHYLANDDTIGMVWYMNSAGKIIISLRSSDNGPDVSILAERWGGGGHMHASGFVCNIEDLNNILVGKYV